MATRRRPLCADLSRDNGEPLAATASRIDRWVLVEYSGRWDREPLAGSRFGDEVKAHLRRELRRHAPARLLFIKRPERRGRDAIRLYHGNTLERGARFFRRDLGSYDELLDLDLGAAAGEQLEHPLFVVCTHGKRDRCCAVYGRPLLHAVRDEVEPDWIWEATHVGGDRFAANLVVFPSGLYFGRVMPADVPSLIADSLAGRIQLDNYRGRCCYSFAEQAAERSLREELALADVDDLALAHVGRQSDRWSVGFRTRDGALHEKTVVTEEGEPTYLTCDAAEPQRPRHFRVAP